MDRCAGFGALAMVRSLCFLYCFFSVKGGRNSKKFPLRGPPRAAQRAPRARRPGSATVGLQLRFEVAFFRGFSPSFSRGFHVFFFLGVCVCHCVYIYIREIFFLGARSFCRFTIENTGGRKSQKYALKCQDSCFVGSVPGIFDTEATAIS